MSQKYGVAMSENFSEFLNDVPSEFVISNAPPKQWDAEHVMHRMVHACSVVSRIPYNHPGSLKSAWPAYVYDMDDVASQRELLNAQNEKRLGDMKHHDEEKNRTVVMPSAHDIDLMDEAIYWPMKYLERHGTIELMRWASERAKETNASNGYPSVVYAQATAICEGLILDRVNVR
jgi:hypothetical protein